MTTTWPSAPPRVESAGPPRLGHLVGTVGGGPGLDEHLRGYGPPPRLGDGALTDLAAAAGLTGRGGAAFPTARKLAAIRSRGGRRRPVVVGNGAEGEPASRKDRALLAVRPNLVLDGLQLAAAEVGSDRLVLAISRDPALAQALRALVEDRVRRGVDAREVQIVEAPPRFLAGEESALASLVEGGLGLPRYKTPRVFESGVAGAPTLVQNVESLAQLALIARFGTAWFRSLGLSDEPGSMLVTVRGPSGAQVLETGIGVSMETLLTGVLGAGRPISGTCSAVLVGGYHGAWLPAGSVPGLRLGDADLRPHGAMVGAGVVAALPAGHCGLAETARVVRYLALESAGQCGPCVNGLPAIARGLAELAGPRPRTQVVHDIARWCGLVSGRGACHHPDGTVRLVRSALTVFADELQAHHDGRCSGPGSPPFLPLPAAAPVTDEDWR